MGVFVVVVAVAGDTTSPFLRVEFSLTIVEYSGVIFRPTCIGVQVFAHDVCQDLWTLCHQSDHGKQHVVVKSRCVLLRLVVTHNRLEMSRRLLGCRKNVQDIGAWAVLTVADDLFEIEWSQE